MPELPEVERLARSLRPAILGRSVVGVTVHRRDVITGPLDPPGGYARNMHRQKHTQTGTTRTASKPTYPRLPRALLLLNHRITKIQRHGKQLAILTSHHNTPALIVHLGMTGQLLHTPAGQQLAAREHVHIVWRLDDGSRLAFRDPRRFGGVWAYPSADALHATRFAALGPDALTITADQLAEALAGSISAIKGRLLNQQCIAGVGNIYADEALHAAGIHPTRQARAVEPAEADRLATALRAILAQAIDAGGSTLRDYRDSNNAAGTFQQRHRVYGRAGLPCLTCGTPLDHATIAQRTTVWCPVCQK